MPLLNIMINQMLSNVDRDMFMILFDDEVIGNGVSKIYILKSVKYACIVNHNIIIR